MIGIVTLNPKSKRKSLTAKEKLAHTLYYYSQIIILQTACTQCKASKGAHCRTKKGRPTHFPHKHREIDFVLRAVVK